MWMGIWGYWGWERERESGVEHDNDVVVVIIKALIASTVNLPTESIRLTPIYFSPTPISFT